jgi:lysophospholipase L1-like esterase
MDHRPVRNLVGKLALALGSLLLALVVAEGLARVLGSPARPELGSLVLPPRDPALDGLPVLKGIFDLAKPNVRGVSSGVLHRTNSAGMRGPEVEKEAPPGTFRIGIVGDSFTMGAGVAEEDAYPARVQVLLNERTSGARFEVLNLGLGGLNVRQAVKRLVKVGLPYGPRLVVYGFTVNDIEKRRDARREPDADERRLLAKWKRFADSRSHLLRIVWPRLVSLRENVWHLPGSYPDSLRNDYDNPEKWARITGGLDLFAAIGERLGICVHVLIHTFVADLHLIHPFSDIYERVGEAARERGLTVSQSLPLYRWHNAADLRVSVIDSHPNPEGHRLLAETLVEGLARLPNRCGPPPIGGRR